MPLSVNSVWSWSGIKRALEFYLKFLGRIFNFFSGSSVYQFLRMPTHCGDPVTSALQQSLLTQRRLKDSSVLNFKLVTNAKQVLDAHIKYETVFTSSNQPVEKLKAQYTVLSTLGATSSSQLSTSASSPSSPSKPSPVPSTSPSSSSHHGNRPQFEKASPPNEPTVPVPKRTLFPPEAVVVGWKGNSVPIGSGFVNLGNTCYLNSTLQALFHVPAFVNWLMSDKAHFTKCEMMNGMTHSECLICAMAKTLQSSHKLTGAAIKPSNIYSKLKLICKHLNPGHQEDAHEFLRYLLEGMERSYLSIFNGLRLDNLSKETTPLGQIFGGYIRTEVTCLECKHISTTFQHFQDLILDIRTASSVEEALEHYFARERLGDDGDHAYKCEQCKRRVAATKKFSLERPPKALCVQLKRFGVLGGKNNKHITIKQWLDMTKFRHRPSVSSQLRYKLVAMVNHHGHSSSCGHYTAVGLTSNGNYYLFDDNSVRQMPLSNVLSTNPYILMYELDSIELAKEKDRSPSKHSTKVEQTPLTNGTTNGALFKSASADKLKSPPAKPSYGRLSPLKFNMNVKLSQSAPNLTNSAATAATTSPSQASSSSSMCPSSRPQSPFSNSSGSTSSLGKPGTSKTPQKTKASNSEGPSLVPYLSESSDSESESTPYNPAKSSTTPTPSLSSPPTTNGWVKNELNDEEPGKNGLPEGTIPQEKRNGDTCSRPAVPLGPVKVEVEKGSWPSTPARTDLPSPAGSVSSGKWSVTSCDKDKSPERPRENNVTQNSTVQSLLRMSHQGYGHTGINTWNGNRSQMDKEIAKDREANKRSRSPFDSMDRGKVKKMKYNNSNNNNMNMNKDRSRNRFQDYQNRKNNWNPRPRQEYYRNYCYKPNNNNYNNNNRFNSNNYWRH
uniref:Ubiquitin carboxyl-terminal hydrolase n=2 Tax=Lygus hesperus TaxID=30085 RepID=A0A0K8STZ8_LYGHE